MTESMIERVAHVLTGYVCGQCKCSNESGWADAARDCAYRQAARDVLSALRDHKVVVRINGEAVHEISGEPNDLWQMFLEEGLK